MRNKNQRQKKGKSRGFTLVELLVATAVFSLIIIGISSALIMTLKNQRKIIAIQENQEDARYALEKAIKEIRMSHLVSSDSGGAGVSTLSLERDVDNSGDMETIDYRFNNSRLERQLESGGYSAVTPSGTTIDGDFYIYENSAPYWSKVAITMEIEVSEGEESAKTYLQNSVMLRTHVD